MDPSVVQQMDLYFFVWVSQTSMDGKKSILDAASRVRE